MGRKAKSLLADQSQQRYPTGLMLGEIDCSKKLLRNSAFTGGVVENIEEQGQKEFA